MGFKLGLEAVIQYSVGGIDAANWLTMDDVRDVTLNMEKSEADVTTRGNNRWRAIVAALKEATIEFDSVWDTENVGFAAFRDSWLNDTILGIRVLDTDASGGEGLQADCMVFNFSRNEPLEEVITASISLKPTFSETAPSWHTVP